MQTFLRTNSFGKAIPLEANEASEKIRGAFRTRIQKINITRGTTSQLLGSISFSFFIHVASSDSVQ